MAVIDIIILILTIPFIIKGFKNGFIKQVTGVASLIIGVYLAYRFSDLVSGYLHKLFEASENVTKIISFALIMIVVILLISLVTKLVQKLIDITMLTWLDKALGILFSVAAAALILGLIISLINFINESWFTILPEKVISESVLYRPLGEFTETIFPYLKEFFHF